MNYSHACECETESAEDQAIPAERTQVVAAKVSHQEGNRRVRGYAGKNSAHDGLDEHDVTSRSGQFTDFEETRRKNHGRRKKKRVLSGVLVIQIADQPRHDGRA